MRSVLDIHAGKRIPISENYIDLHTPNVKFGLFLLKGLEDNKGLLHIQKFIQKDDDEIPRKGGFMLEAEYLPELKAIIDKLYLDAIDSGLI